MRRTVERVAWSALTVSCELGQRGDGAAVQAAFRPLLLGPSAAALLGQEAIFSDTELVIALSRNNGGLMRWVAFALAPGRGPEHELEVANILAQLNIFLKS